MPDTERLAAFLFRLMRDELPSGVLEAHLSVVELAHPVGADVIYVDGAVPLGEYARTLAKRLVPDGT